MADRVVVGPVVVLPNTAGLQQYYYQGATLPDGLDEARVADAVASGLVSETKTAAELTIEDLSASVAGDRFRGLGATTGDGVSMIGAPGPAPAALDGPPPRAASKDAWVDYAVTQGAVREDAEQASKQELVAAYGA